MDIVDKMLPEDSLKKKHKNLIYQHICIILTKNTGVNMHKTHVDIYCDVAQGSLRSLTYLKP